MRPTCLIIDESAVIRNVAERVLDDLGYQTIHAENAAAAIGYCASNVPDVMMVDWHLSEPDSYELIKQIKNGQAEGNQTMTIFLSSEFDVPAMTKAKRAGADAFFLKPFDRATLSAKWQELGLVKQAA